MKELGHKVAVVTGGASGIGRGMAEAFAAEGMKLVLADIENAIRRWRISAWQILGRDKLGIRSLARYLKLRQAIGQIRKRLSQSR